MEHSSSHSLHALLRTGLSELDLDPALAQPLATLCELLATWAARMNLTGHRTPEAIAQRLVFDALALGAALPLTAAPETLADLGSGAGFPGLPLAIRWPASRVTLVEARERRHHFQRAAIRALGLQNADPRRGRLEDLAPQPHAVVVAQALAQPEQAVRWMLPWVAPGGWIVLPRAAEAPELETPPGLEDAHTIPYCVPFGGPERNLWVARRPVGVSAGPVVRRECPPH